MFFTFDDSYDSLERMLGHRVVESDSSSQFLAPVRVCVNGNREVGCRHVVVRRVCRSALIDVRFRNRHGWLSATTARCSVFRRKLASLGHDGVPDMAREDPRKHPATGNMMVTAEGTLLG